MRGLTQTAVLRKQWASGFHYSRVDLIRCSSTVSALLALFTEMNVHIVLN